MRSPRTEVQLRIPVSGAQQQVLIHVSWTDGWGSHCNDFARRSEILDINPGPFPLRLYDVYPTSHFWYESVMVWKMALTMDFFLDYTITIALRLQ